MTIALNSVKFGTDAEFFVRTISGQPIPICGMVGGTKDKPRPLPGLPVGFAVQEDNAAAEFNVPATKSRGAFITNVEAALMGVKRLLPKSVILDYDCSSLVFNEDYLTIPEMLVFGCEPDYNAFTMSANEVPTPPQPGFRSAAAHVHIGWDNPTDDDRLDLIRLCDVFVVCTSLQKENETEKARRKLYGKSGAFRPKTYGVEHRVLSNKWCTSAMSMSHTLTGYVEAIAALNAGVRIDEDDYKSVMDAINTPHTKLATSLSKKYGDRFAEAVGPNFSFRDLYEGFR